MKKPLLVGEVKKFVDELAVKGGKPLYELSPEEARNVLINVQNAPTDKTGVSIKDIRIPAYDDEEITVRFVCPEETSENLPIIYYVHGGGWVMGNLETHERLMVELAKKVHAAVIYPVYTSSPEARYPRALRELFVVLSHITENADRYQLDAERLAVAGDSVGGNMATALTLMAKANDNMTKIKAQLLLYPVTNDDFNTDSYNDFAEGPWLTKKAMIWFWEAYAPEKDSHEEILACPLKAETSVLEGLPPALVITAENDVLRDEGEAYARKLDEAGVAVSCVRINGTIHDFMMLNALADTQPTKTAFMLAEAYLKKVFGTNESC